MTDFHIHTLFCDGTASPEEMARSAFEKGMSAIGFSGHSFLEQDEEYCMSREGTLEYSTRVLRLRREYAGKMDIYLGIERDFLSTDSFENFDYVIGSVHYVQKNGACFPIDMSEQELIDLVNSQYGGDFFSLAEDYYEAVGEMAEKTSPDIIGHFDLITKYNSGGHLFDENDPRYVAASTRALVRAAEYCGVFELNSGAVFRGYRRHPYPSPTLLRQIAALDGQVMLNSDAHAPEAIGFFRKGMVKLALEAGFTHESVVTASGIREIPLEV